MVRLCDSRLREHHPLSLVSKFELRTRAQPYSNPEMKRNPASTPKAYRRGLEWALHLRLRLVVLVCDFSRQKKYSYRVKTIPRLFAQKKHVELISLFLLIATESSVVLFHIYLISSSIQSILEHQNNRSAILSISKRKEKCPTNPPPRHRPNTLLKSTTMLVHTIHPMPHRLLLLML